MEKCTRLEGDYFEGDSLLLGIDYDSHLITFQTHLVFGELLTILTEGLKNPLPFMNGKTR